MKLSAKHQDHIKALGDKWQHALAAAALSVRINPKLVGQDKIREPLMFRAALAATGCDDVQGFAVATPGGDAENTPLQQIVDKAFNDAVDAVRLKMKEAA